MPEATDTANPIEIEMQTDLERYARLLMASRETWLDFWLLGTLSLIGGAGVFVFSGETWGVLLGSFVFLLLLFRTSRIIGRFDGELSFLHRKWIRRGLFFITDGRSVQALPHEAEH